MWPWGHFAVAYLLYVGIVRLRGHQQRLLPLVAVIIGSQLPDLVDKPLAWTFEILPAGRSLMHSLITVLVVVTVAYWGSQRLQQEDMAIGLSIGMVSHIFVDPDPSVMIGLLQGHLGQLQWTTYLLWPLLPVPPYRSDLSSMQVFLSFRLDPFEIFEFILFAVAVIVWFRSDAPILRTGLGFAR
jgi:hypothetical protein